MTTRIRLYINDYLALATLCFVIIVYQLSLTKLLSVIAWYHYTFLTLSLVMFGLGAPGIWFTLTRNPARFLPRLLLASGVSMIASELFILHVVHRIQDHFLFIFMIIDAILVPMLCLGSCVCIYLMKAEGKQFGKMYAADLLGAFAGAAVIIPLINLLPVPMIIASLACLVLLVLIANTKKLVRPACIALLGIGVLFVLQEPLHLYFTKYDEKNEGVIYEKWTPTTRITVFNHIFWRPDHDMGFPWGAGTHFPKQKIEQYWIEQDASAGTPLTRFDGDLTKTGYLLYDVTSAAHLLRPAQSAIIIGGGGGRDILTALTAGIKDITAVELNQGMVDTVSKKYGEFSGDIYHRPFVHPVVSEGRSFLSRSAKTYDLIQISLIDSWAASLAGAFALAENNLYTKEAYKAYFARLSPGGMVTTSRWIDDMGETEVIRLTLLAYEALKESGVADPQNHIAIIRGGNIGNVIISKSPFSAADREQMQKIVDDKGFRFVYPQPASETKNIYTDLLSDHSQSVVDEYLKKGIDISAPTDNRPFFFNALRPFDFAHNGTDGHNNLAVQVLRQAVLIVMLLAAIAFFLPFLLNWKIRLLPFSELCSSSLYFTIVGIGFMTMEIYMLHRFILYLGHPSYAASVVLSCLLLGMAAGSFISARVSLASFRRYIFLLPLLLFIAGQALEIIFKTTLHFDFPVKILMAAGVLLPCAFLGGFFFPLGIERYGNAGKAWFWAINGSFGVFASVMSLPVAMTWGYATILYAACLSYLIAGSVLLLRKS